MRDLEIRLSSLARNTISVEIRKPLCFRLDFIKCLAELEDDTCKCFLGNLENGDTIGPNKDLGIPNKSSLAKQNDESTTRRKIPMIIIKLAQVRTRPPRHVIDEDMEERLVSALFRNRKWWRNTTNPI